MRKLTTAKKAPRDFLLEDKSRRRFSALRRLLSLAASQKVVIAIAVLSVFLFVYAVKIAVNVYAGSETEKLVIIMYHSVLKDEDRRGEYVISPVELEKDLKYLSDNGYTTVTSNELIDFVYSKKALPKKRVMLTFDDGALNNLTYVLPLLEKYNMRAVFSVVGSFCDREEESKNRSDSYSYLSWSEARELCLSGFVEIACHTYALHTLSDRSGAQIMSGESYSEYRSVLISDLNRFITESAEKAGVIPTIFTYPYGYISEESLNLVKTCGFRISLGCEEKTNTLSFDKSSLYCLGRYNRSGSETTDEFMKKAGL